MCAQICRISPVRLLLVAGLTGFCGTASAEAGDESKHPLSCSLQPKYLESDARFRVLRYHSSAPHPYQPATRHYSLPARDSWLAGQATGTFSRIVRIEPSEYRSQRPFRGVVTLGSRQFAFVFDIGDGGPLDYGRLHFDRNCNGDLTDDPIIAATGRQKDFATHTVLHVCSFPRVHVTLEVEGTEWDYAFFVRSCSRGANMENIRSVSAAFCSAVYREGELTLNGEPRRVVLLDYNSNGRFNDAFCSRVSEFYGTIHANIRDKLLIETRSASAESMRRFELEERHVSKLIEVDGRYYRPEVSNTGDKLTLTPLSLPIGHVVNPNEQFVALVHSDGKILRIRGSRSELLPLPEGEWNLLSYTINIPSERPSRIEGQATTECTPVSVRRGQTVVFPFGPPLRPIAKVTHLIGQNEAGLVSFMLGTAGESCAPLVVQGRLSEPEMTISTPAGRVVVRDKFRYGCSGHLFYQWILPSELADEYHVRVRLEASPFEVENTGYSVIPKSKLVREKRKRSAN